MTFKLLDNGQLYRKSYATWIVCNHLSTPQKHTRTKIIFSRSFLLYNLLITYNTLLISFNIILTSLNRIYEPLCDFAGFEFAKKSFLKGLPRLPLKNDPLFLLQICPKLCYFIHDMADQSAQRSLRFSHSSWKWRSKWVFVDTFKWCHRSTGCSWKIAFFSKNYYYFATSSSQALGFYWLTCKEFGQISQSIGVTVLSQCVESCENLLQWYECEGWVAVVNEKHNFS